MLFTLRTKWLTELFTERFFGKPNILQKHPSANHQHNNSMHITALYRHKSEH